MNILAIGSIIVLFAIVAGVNASPLAFADHKEVEVQLAMGSGTPGCETTNECYLPYEVTIDVGGEVTWVNDDTVLHTVTAGDIKADSTLTGTSYPNGFDSGYTFTNGKTFAHKFDTAGTYPYYCTVHPWMEGIVYVEGEEPDPPMMAAMQPTSLDEIMISIKTPDEQMQGKPLPIEVAITNLEGEQLAHVNFKVMATQGETEILVVEKEHAHEGMATIMIPELAMSPEEMPIDFKVELLGFGVGEITGPSGELATVQVVPEFGTIAMMILGIAIVSIIAITAKSRVIPRI